MDGQVFAGGGGCVQRCGWDERAAERIEQQRGERPPAIAMSGFGMEDDLVRSRAAGFSEHMTKPVLLAALNQAIGPLANGALIS